MSKKIIIVLILGVAVSFVAVDVRAQADAPTDEPAEELAGEAPEESLEGPAGLESLFNPGEGAEELRTVKEQIQALLRQNAELSPQARSLEKELRDLQKEVDQSRAEVSALEKGPAPEQTNPAGDQEGPEQSVANAAGPGQPQSLRLLQLYDLQYQKKELELQLKLQELALQEKQQAHDREIAALQKELEQNTIEEQQLAGEAQGPSKPNGGPGYELECVKQENILLENQLQLLKASSEFAGTGQRPGDLPGPVWQSIRQKEAQKQQLQQKIARLEMGQRSPSAGVNVSIFETQFRGPVTQLEKENRDLQDQIFSLKEKAQKRSQ